ncbi:DUF2914 domain-containing protein [Thermodesulfobacteriota bacterium]
MFYKCLLFFLIYSAGFLYPPDLLFAQTNNHPSPEQISQDLTLTQAVMCEGIQNHLPQNISVVFSIELEKVCCYTTFDPVPKKGNIYHTWYYRNKFINIMKLAINPPRWSTFSSIQLRKMDKGPWRVEISDDFGKIYSILRFSITD